MPERITHPNPSKAAQGLTKTGLALDPDRAPIVAQIYGWRIDEKLATPPSSTGSGLPHEGSPAR